MECPQKCMLDALPIIQNEFGENNQKIKKSKASE